MNYSLGRSGDPDIREHMSSCRKCQKRMQDMEAGLVEAAEEEALPNAPLAPAVQLQDQKSAAPKGNSAQKRKRPARAV
tara:strand:- start:20 stop:253 length:234 start_codon:yes stop_codon:yes gene_type:complete